MDILHLTVIGLFFAFLYFAQFVIVLGIGWIVSRGRAGRDYWRGRVFSAGVKGGAFGGWKRVGNLVEQRGGGVNVEDLGGADCAGGREGAAALGLLEGLATHAEGGGAFGGAGELGNNGFQNHNDLIPKNRARWRVIMSSCGAQIVPRLQECQRVVDVPVVMPAKDFPPVVLARG